MASDDPTRLNPNLLLSAHPAGGMRKAFSLIGEMGSGAVAEWLGIEGIRTVGMRALRDLYRSRPAGPR